MREALSDELLRYMQIPLYDVGPASDDGERRAAGGRRLLFDSHQIHEGPSVRRDAENESAAFVYTVPVEIASRVWEFQYRADKTAVIGDTDRILPPLVLASGLLSSVLLFGMFYSLASSQPRRADR